MTTQSTWGMSRPREATSVEIRIDRFLAEERKSIQFINDVDNAVFPLKFVIVALSLGSCIRFNSNVEYCFVVAFCLHIWLP